jgi:cobalt-zinc-cadmium efflux system membrane fusion protein
MTKFSNIILLILLGSIIFLYGCTNSTGQVSITGAAEIIPEDIVEMRDDQIKLAGVGMGMIEMRTLSINLKVNGVISVAPKNLATVCMPLGGFIKSTNLLPGNRVSKGQTLAVIENQEFIDIQQNYLEAKNKLNFAEAEFNRHTDLYKNDVYSESNLQQVTMDYKNLKAVVKSLEQKLILIGINPQNLSEENISSTVNLVSPISGFLKEVNVNIGKYVSPNDILFEIVNNEDLFLELTLFEKDADKVTVGQKVIFFINNETEEHEAIINQTGKSVNADKTFRVYANITSPCKNLLPGMYVNAVVKEDERKVTSLPSEAVVSFNDKDFIFVYEKDKEEGGKPFTEYKIVEITKGISESGFTEIKVPEGLDISIARIVIKGAYNLLSAKKNAGEMAC